MPAPVGQHRIDDPGNEAAVHQVRYEVAPLRQGAAHQGRGCGREGELEEELREEGGRHWEADKVGGSAQMMSINDDILGNVNVIENLIPATSSPQVRPNPSAQ